jgi:transcriptional regulator with XRE-family HTH domain
MSRRNMLVLSPPHSVEQTILQLGENLRVARIRRNMTIADVAQRIGTGPRAVMDAEKGKASTGLVVYAALLWLYNQLDQLSEVADPSKDKEGLALDSVRHRQRARKGAGLDNDF